MIVPAWRAEATLARTLRSLFDSNREALDRVIVVTEASDGSARVARSFSGVELVELDRRASAGRARCLGRASAGCSATPSGSRGGAAPDAGGLLLFLDADCALAPGAAAAMIEALEGGGLDAVGASIQGEGGGAVGWLRHLLEFKDFEPGVPVRTPAFVPSAALLVRARAFDLAGGFPDMWPGEDLVFCSRLLAGGGRLGRTDRAVATHLHPGGLAAYVAHQYRLGTTSARARTMTAAMRGRAFAEHRWLTPLLFFGRAGRAAAWLVRFRPRELPRFAALLPLYLTGLAAWTAGFAIGGAGGGEEAR